MEETTGDDIISCPYDRGHRLLRKRLQLHLLKCRLNYPDVELRKCPINQLHLVPEPEYENHLSNCPDRKLIVQYKYEGPDEYDGTKFLQHDPIDCDENWDDTDIGNYDPEIYSRNMQIIRQPIGGPSQRKAFKAEEANRFKQFE